MAIGTVIHGEDAGSGGGSGTGWNGQVEFRGDLPITLGNPPIGSIYLVEKPTTILFGAYKTYQSGLYIKDTDTGSLSDWRRLNVKVNFTDSEFALVSAADNSKRARFDLSLITASTTRTYTYQDKDGTIALLSDIVLQDLQSVLNEGFNTGGNDIETQNNDKFIPENGETFLNLRDGAQYEIVGADVNGGGITGFAYLFDGDITFTATIGTEIEISGTPAGVNDGIHTISDVDYDGTNTRVQWSGIVTELGTPYGKMTIPQDGWLRLGDSDNNFFLQDVFGFKLIGIINKYSASAFSEFYSFFGFTYMWNTDREDANPANHRQGGFTVHNNRFSSGTTTLGSDDSYPTSASVSRVLFGVNLPNIFAGGAKWITARIQESITSRRFVINHPHTDGSAQGAPFEHIIDSIYPTEQRTWVLPDKSDTFAGLQDILKTKSGIVPIASFAVSGGNLRATVNFSTAFADANYSISLMETTNANRRVNMKVDSAPTSAGFTISLGTSNPNNIVDVRWIAIKNGEN